MGHVRPVGTVFWTRGNGDQSTRISLFLSSLSLSPSFFSFFARLLLSYHSSWFPPTSKIPVEGQRTSNFVFEAVVEREIGDTRVVPDPRDGTPFDGIAVAASTDWMTTREPRQK